MRALAVVDYEIAGHRNQAILTPAGWQVRGHPDPWLPPMLDRAMKARPTSGADPDPLRTAARHVAHLLGGEVRWVRKLKDRGPGWIN